MADSGGRDWQDGQDWHEQAGEETAEGGLPQERGGLMRRQRTVRAGQARGLDRHSAGQAFAAKGLSAASPGPAWRIPAAPPTAGLASRRGCRPARRALGVC